jgi:tetratricopeptide (TPR) repeat protein
MSRLDDGLGLKDVIIAASKTGDDGPSALTLVGIAHILAKSGDVDGLLNVAAAAQGIGRYQDVLTTVGLALTRMGRFELSKSVLARVKWKEELPNYRWHGKLLSAYNLVLFNIAQVLALTDRLEQALRLAKDMDTHSDIPELDTEIDKEYLSASGDHPSRDETYVAVARTWLSQADACHDSEGVLQEAIEIVGRIEKATNRFYGLTILARSLSESGRQSQACEVLEAALQTAEAIESSEEQARALITAVDMLGRYVVRRILAHADELTKDIEDVETRVRTSIRLAKITIQIEEPDWAKKIISRLVPDILSRFESVNVFLLTQFADLYIQMEELSSAREILSLASEAIKGSESELDELFLSIIQCRVHCRVGNPGQAQSFATSAIKAFDRCNFFSRSPFKSMCQDKLIELLIEMTDICPQDNLVSVLLDSLDNTRSRGRGVVLEQIGLFAPILEELDVISESWDRIQAIEHCRGSSKLKSFD